ncbi:hypothetical protein [Marinigracilibium pacificum]|uniref:Asl1-like glycosyl hydrolase catalytic domain-containing protein n=1 Tax=Marinigracilibium pacificum TaxID=2729599 RepID=A0A848IY99_9BACT|nr:hypothetical protein [Marinigracilibium pacificum]NMM47224.1 hypothetical protein [Marinigracilibium pacificum]
MLKSKCKTIFCILIIIIYTKLTVSAQIQSHSVDNIIKIEPEKIINTTTKGDAFKLFDEQNIDNPQHGWKPPYSPKWNYPAEIIIDLQDTYEIDYFKFYDGSATGELEINYGNPFKWTAGIKTKTDRYNQWQKKSVTWKTQYIQIILHDPNVNINEIIFSGRKINTSEKFKTDLTPGKTKKTALKNVIGTNSFIDVPHSTLSSISMIREYHQWDWMEGDRDKNYIGYPNNQNRFNPTLAGGGWNFDNYYETLFNNGKTVVPVMVGTTLWLTKEGPETLEKKPAQGNPADPESYKAHADHMFQFAARYGDNKVKTEFLKLHSSQSKVSGLGYLNYYENWNEPDKWWMTNVEFFSPFEYSAMSSADYDGHESTLGNTLGIKNADPNSKLVMAGLATLNLDYLISMKFWCDHNRTDKRFIWDVINFHHYSNNGGVQHGKATSGISPEADSLYYKIKRISDYRNINLPTKELWITEFGYDTQSKGSQIAPQIGTMTSEQVQASWLIRSIIIGHWAGADKMFQFMLRDGNENSFQTYQNSGLTSSKHTGYKKKASWYFLSTVNYHVGDFYLSNVDVDPNTNLYTAKFVKEGSSTTILILWLGSSKDARMIVDLKTNRYYNPKNIIEKKVQLMDEYTVGLELPINTNQDKTSIEVSETPIIVILN